MKLPWKQFEASDIALKHNMFLKARLKITALYVFILIIIVVVFSIFLYQNISSNLLDTQDDDFRGTESRIHFVDQTLTSVQGNIVIADLIVITIATILSYFLAGQTLRPIQKSLESQKSFAAQASHELRTPLTIMKTDVESILKNKSYTKGLVEEAFRSNLEEIDHLTTIAENLLLLARSDNNIAPDFTVIDIKNVILGVVNRVSGIAKEKNINIHFSPTDVFEVKGNEKAFSRVILNILQNSLDHTSHNGLVSIDIQKDKKVARIKIYDTGSGIEPKDLPNIFDRFYKGSMSSNDHRTGLGLSIVQEIIIQHHGKVEINSTLGKGTTVMLNLPLV